MDNLTQQKEHYSFALKPKNVHIKDNTCAYKGDDRTMHRNVIFNPAFPESPANEYPKVHHVACRDCGLQFKISISNTEINIWEESNYQDLTEFGVPERNK